MDKPVEALFEALRRELADLPGEELDRALAYYEEYFAEAREEGEDEAALVARLGGAEGIAAALRAEALIARAEKSPGPVALARASQASRAARRGREGLVALARASLLPVGFFPLLFAMASYLLAVASWAASLASVGVGVLAWLDVDPSFTPSRFGAVGIGLLGLSFFAALALGLWRAGNALSRLTLGLIRRGLGREAPMPEHKRRKGFRFALAASGLGFLAALGILGASGLARGYLSIWLSSRPASIKTIVGEWKTAEVSSLSIETLNAAIEFREVSGHPGIIRVVYEETEWTRPRFELSGGSLLVKEESSRRLPLFDYVAIHPGTQVLSVEFPAGYRPKEFAVKSLGGAISLGPLAPGK